jgi:hypothetical protein
MTKCKMGRAVSLAFLASTAAFGLVVSVADATGCFAKFTYARATVNWRACSNGVVTNTTEDLETSAGTCAMSAFAATVAGQCGVVLDCDQAQATGSGNLESFFASTFTFPCLSTAGASAEIRYTALRRHKGNITLDTVVGPTQYFPRGDYVRTGRYFEISAIFLPMDINEDGIVDGRDLAQLLHEWGSTSPTTLADTNCDGIVDLIDLSRLLATWKTDGATP